MVIKVSPGDKKPYYIKSKGPKPSGVYIRYGRNKSQASQEEIARMIRESQNVTFEELISKRQDLTFEVLKGKLKDNGIEFIDFKLITSGFVDANTNLFTNLAFWFSDQYDIDTKMAVYQGLDRNIFRSKKEFDGSIVKQIDQVIEYFNLCNEVRVIIDGSPIRQEIPSYNIRAVREGILNCFCHRDFSRKSNIKIEFFDNRCELISPGGFYDGLTLEAALSGVQSFRNENLVKLLFKLGYIENYASGLSRIFSEYKKSGLVPVIESSLVALKLTLPNKNYVALFINEPLNEPLNSRQLKLLKIIEEYPNLNKKDLTDKMNVSRATVERYLSALVENGYVKKVGARKTVGYIVIKNSKDR